MSKRKNYNKMYDHPEQEAPATEVEPTNVVTTPAVEETPVEVTYKPGVVANCEKLNVRLNPSLKSAVNSVLPKGTKLEFQPIEDHDEWVLVRVPDSTANGFCMKKYIEPVK